MSKITVIIPVYNVQDYLTQCVESVIGQTHRDLEIILVDDGSTDNSPAMCDEFARRDNRIRVIHQENAGLGAARNAGLAAATGDYLFFIDSDDWINENCMADMLQSAITNDSDLVLMGEYLYYEDTGKITRGWRDFTHERPTKITPTNFIKYFTPVCARLYRHDFIKRHNLKFIEHCFYEDNSWGCLCMCLANRISFTPSHYYYRQRTSSITGIKDRRIIDWCHDFQYFYDCASRLNIDPEKRRVSYLWYAMNFHSYSRYIANLSHNDRLTYFTLLRDNVFARMNLTRHDFTKDGCIKNPRRIFGFYASVMRGKYRATLSKGWLFTQIPLVSREIVYNIK